MSDPKEESLEQKPQSEETSAEAARRRTLARLGLFGAYTAPALVSMMVSNKVAAAPIESGGTG